MSIRVLPSKLLKKMAPKKKVQKLVTKRLTLNRAVLSALAEVNILSKKALETIALKVIKGYKEKVSQEVDDGTSKAQATDDTINEGALMVQRVQNAAVHEIVKEVKTQYRGEFYKWLPSDAETPSPLHQLNYGKTFQLGVGDDNGEDPGDRYGCRCGMEILVDETRLKL